MRPEGDDEPNAVRRARRDGVAIAVAVGIVGVVFGVLARATGLSVAKTCVMSLLVFTGASQFAAVGVIGAGGSSMAALGSALLLAARNALYGPVVAQWFGQESRPARAALAQVIIDESTGVGAAQTTRSGRRAGFLAGGVGCYIAWNLATLLGATAGGFIGDLETWGLDAAFPAVYVAILAPHLSTSPGRITALVGAAITLALVPALPVGLPVLGSTVGAVVGAVLAYRERLPRHAETS